MRISKKWFTALPFGLLLLAVVTGCGYGDRPTLAEVKGTLLKGGKPVKNARVEFHPRSEAAFSYGETDEEGHFRLFYSTGPAGAAIGMHDVILYGVKRSAATAEEGDEDSLPGTLRPVGAPDVSAAAEKAGPAEVEGLSAEVVSGANDITLEI